MRTVDFDELSPVEVAPERETPIDRPRYAATHSLAADGPPIVARPANGVRGGCARYIRVSAPGRH